MCVIIDKKAGFAIPEEKLISARQVNPHGFGIVVPNDGRLVTRKILNPTDEEIIKIINEFKEFPAKIHFRYKTQGTITEDNLHPFQILNKDDHGIDLIMMHNGTLYDFNPKGKDNRSDSRIFAEDFVRPFFERMETIGYENILNDPFVKQVLDKFVSASSKVLFTDSEDNTLIINKASGAEHDFGWSSNTYSFDSTHREKKATTYRPGVWGGTTPATSTNSGGSRTHTVSTLPKTGASQKKPVVRVQASVKKSDQTKSPSEKKTNTEAANGTISSKSHEDFKKALEYDNLLSFTDVAEIKDLKEIGFLSLSDLEYLNKQYPDVMAAVCRELYYISFGEIEA